MDQMFKILAVLGALAWLSPWVTNYLKDRLSKPVIKIICGDDIEIGYTQNGPILNTSIALVAENKKALVDKIEIEITHENNGVQKFKWKWFEEVLYTQNTVNGSIPTVKNQTAIAINVLKDELVEKKIGFNQEGFLFKKRELEQKTSEVALNIAGAGQEEGSLRSDANYNNLINLYKNNFIWNVGDYSIKYKIYESSIKKPFELELSFKISALDLEELCLNINKCVDDVERIYIDSSKDFPTFNWVNILINET